MTPAEIRFFEELTLNSSGALKQIFYDGWILRFSPGSNTKRANSVTALYASTQSIDAKLAYCETTYAYEGMLTRFRVSEFSDPPYLDTHLAACGYDKVDSTLFMLCDLEKHGTVSSSLDVKQLAINDWLQINHALRGDTKETIAAHRSRLESISLRHFPIACFINGEPVSMGLGIQQDNYFGLFDIFTPKNERGKGYGRLITQHLMQLAHQEQARFAFLQVEEHNKAQQIYKAVGFEAVYRYWYRVKNN